MKKFVSRSVKGLFSGVTKWVRGLTKFEKLLLGLTVVVWGLFILAKGGNNIVGNIDDYRLENKRRPYETQLKALSAQVQQKESRNLSEVEKNSVLEREYPKYPRNTTSPFYVEVAVEETELSCDSTELKQKEKPQIFNPIAYSPHTILLVTYLRPPKNQVEKDYCDLIAQLSSLKLKGSSQLINRDFRNSFVIVAFALSGLFIGVEFIKYTIRAALDKK